MTRFCHVALAARFSRLLPVVRIAGLVACAAAGEALAAAEVETPEPQKPAEAPASIPVTPVTPVTPVAPKPKIIVLGIDGVSFNVLDPYIAAGVTPNLGKLIDEGARGDLVSYWPLRTPQIWTSVATGKLPGQHGIWDHISNSAYNPPEFRTKQRKQLTSSDRKSKALWQILGTAGIKSLTVGWVSTWPAEETANATIAAPAAFLNDKRQVSIKGSYFRDAPQQIAPTTLWSIMEPAIVESGDLTAEEILRFADLPKAGSPLLRLPFLKRYVKAIPWSIARAKSVEGISLALLPSATPDLLMTYFQCSDTLMHRFWIFKESEEEISARLGEYGIPRRHAKELKERFGRVVEACYRDIDERVGRLLAAARGPDTLVLMVSDHGFGPREAGVIAKDEPYGGNHRELGVIVAAGPGITPKGTITGASVLDIAPTVLYAFGLPIGADMRGHIIAGVFTEGALYKTPPKIIPSYEDVPQRDVPYANGWPERDARPVALDH